MTGAEIIAVSPSTGKCAYMSVRHSGYDVLDFFGEKEVPFDSLGAPILAYLSWRHEGMSDISMMSENDETRLHQLYEWETKRPTDILAETHELLQSEMREAIYADDELGAKYDSFLCSYGDFKVLIDADAHKVYLLEWQGNHDGKYVLVEAVEAHRKQQAEDEERRKQFQAAGRPGMPHGGHA